MSFDTPLLRVENLVKHYPVTSGFLSRQRSQVKAVDGISFDIRKGETLSLVGESGCGKSTVGRAVAGLHAATAGQIVLNGREIGKVGQTDWNRRVQMVFQDPYSSLNPRMRVRDILAEPLRNFGLSRGSAETEARIARLIDLVRLPRDAANRFPHEFSGGQRQRIGIARALAPEPEIIICDEAVSALDVSVKAQIVNLLQDLRHDLGLSLLFISHDLAIVDHITDRVAVMYLGRIVELASRDVLFNRPRHPYTRALLSAVPVVDDLPRPARQVLTGDLPSPFNPPSGCTFRTRCPLATDRCAAISPDLRPVAAGHLAACLLLETGQTLPSTISNRE